MMEPENNAQRLARQLELLEAGYEDILTGSDSIATQTHQVRFRDGRLYDLLAMRFVPDVGQPFTMKLWIDQTEREGERRDIEQQLNLLKTLTDLLPDQLFFKDTSLRYTEVNESFVVHHKLESSAEILGLCDSTLLTKAYAQRSEEKDRYILDTGKPMISELREEVRLNGDHVWNQTTKLPFYDSVGEIAGVFLLQTANAREAAGAASRT